MKGEQNPNWKGGSQKRVCVHCKKEFEVSYTKRHTQRYCSNHCSGSGNIMLGRHYHSNAKGGKREDLNNRYFRSSWEANWARYLNWLISIGEILKWEYEVDSFEFAKIKKGSRFYIPDFKVYNNDESIEYHEVKGYLDQRSQTKLKRMAKYYPKVKLILVDKPVYKDIERKLSRLIPNWE